MGSHSVTCHPAEVTFPPLPQPKLILDLATPEDARLSWLRWWLYPKIVYPRNTVTYLRNNQTVWWPGLEPATWKSQVQRPNHYTTEPPLVNTCRSHLRSTNLHQLSVPQTSTYGDRSFAASEPSTWNSLVAALRSTDVSVETFRTQLKLKTFLFNSYT